MGATELRASLAPRSQMKRSFFPFSPMLPSARARFITKGISTRVESATARLLLAERPRKLRRVRRFNWLFCILLFVKTLQDHQHRHHPPDPRVIVGRVGQDVE